MVSHNGYKRNSRAYHRLLKNMTKKQLSILLCIITSIVFTVLFFWYSSQKITLKKTPYSQLKGWENVSLNQSLVAFRISCKTFLKQNPEKSVGTPDIAIQVKDWLPACNAAMVVNSHSEKAIKAFFQTWFTPIEFYKHKPIEGLFTGYYMPLLQGSLVKTEKYHVPIYGLPSNLITVDVGAFKPALNHTRLVGRIKGNKLVPFYTREEINNGAIDKEAPVLLWLTNPMDRVFLEIEGSGVVELENGKRVYLGYAGENGAPYMSVAGVLIKDGILTRDTASSEQIKEYLANHPEEIDRVLNQNKSFVFFNELKTQAALGAQGVALTPGYSLAVDRQWVPYGTPIWLNTTIPSQNTTTPLNRLMVAQDTGGAIKGAVRGDTYWGAGDKASYIANHMRAQGRYWLLLPRHITERFK